jgi:hypothetical protein
VRPCFYLFMLFVFIYACRPAVVVSVHIWGRWVFDVGDVDVVDVLLLLEWGKGGDCMLVDMSACSLTCLHAR